MTAMLDTLLTDDQLVTGLIKDVRTGLAARPKWLPPKYFYDDHGSDLFDQITELPEYYPTRAERGLLEQHAHDIVARSGADTLLELGSGSSEKTALLLDAFADGIRAYVPVDVSAGALRGAIGRLAERDPKLLVMPVVADFDRHLELLPRPGTRLVAFLGGTLGNYAPEPRTAFLRRMASALTPGETLLLGVDLVKDSGRLVRAYDDAAGVTAAFNLNVLRVLNRELGADFDLASFTHVARWEPVAEWIEMRLRATRPMRVRIPGADLEIELWEGEEIRTEISAKFRREGIELELELAGFEPAGWWTDGDYALALARRGEGAR